jgi:hypothetical protein
VFFTQLSACSCSFFLDNVTMHNEGVYIPFPSCALKLSNLELNFYLPSLTILNVVYLLRTRAKGSRSIYNIQVRPSQMAHLRFAQQFQSVFKICAGWSSYPIVSTLARLVWEMLLHQEALMQQRNEMMDSFAQILRRLPTGDASSSNGGAAPFKV